MKLSLTAAVISKYQLLMKPGRCSKSGILTFINARLTSAGMMSIHAL